MLQTRLLYIVALNTGTRQLHSTQLLLFHCCTKARLLDFALFTSSFVTGLSPTLRTIVASNCNELDLRA